MSLTSKTQAKQGDIVRIKCLRSDSSHFKAKQIYQGRLNKVDEYSILVGVKVPTKHRAITLNVEMLKNKKHKYGLFSFAPTCKELSG